MKPYNIVVTGEQTHITKLIKCLSFGPDEIINYKYIGADRKTEIIVPMRFGSLEVDEDNRLDFYGGNDDTLFEYINRPSNTDFNGMIVLLDADDEDVLFGFVDNMIQHIEYLRRYSLIIGVIGKNYHSVKQVEDKVRQCLRELDTVAPVFSIDPENKEDVGLMVESLLYFAAPGINDTSRGKSLFKQSDDAIDRD